MTKLTTPIKRELSHTIKRKGDRPLIVEITESGVKWYPKGLGAKYARFVGHLEAYISGGQAR